MTELMRDLHERAQNELENAENKLKKQLAIQEAVIARREAGKKSGKTSPRVQSPDNDVLQPNIVMYSHSNKSSPLKQPQTMKSQAPRQRMDISE